MSVHRCAATGCNRRIAFGLRMCKADRLVVPRELQRAVYRAYKRGAGVGSPEYAEAVLAAIGAVVQAKARAAEAEGAVPA